MPSTAQRALAEAEPAVYWTDREVPEPLPVVSQNLEADLAIIGGGFTGLWAAIRALEDDPGRRVVLVEAEVCGFGASSRNGGFCDASLTHGLENGLTHWPNEIDTLVRFGRDNLDEIEQTVTNYGIDADFRRASEVGVATEPWHLESLEKELKGLQATGHDAEILDADAMQSMVNSPTYLGGIATHGDLALIDPARMVWGLRSLATTLGASIHEGTKVSDLSDEGTVVRIDTRHGSLRAPKVVVATNAYRAPVRQPQRYVIPVYDHVLMTEPLSPTQLESVGWKGREGLGDLSNQFHYYRMTEDNRILWGGYDATYHYGNGVANKHDQDDEIHGKLAEHFFRTFPQLVGLRFTHRWGGPIATTTRFTAAWGRSHEDRVVWAAGYTGLGVGASRFGAQVALDLVDHKNTERTALSMVSSKPFPFPPEPIRWSGVQITRRAIARADRRDGRRGAWLKLLDQFGVGFDS
ncbi:MAG: NAD(P)/FAD-dependent oxidoreductase [Acidimicrobiia bacterium]